MNPAGAWLPIFPLDLALLPGAFLPLHVFEPRYQALVRRSLAGDRRFGVVRLHDGNLAGIGCEARIVRVLQSFPDGRSDLLVRGEGRIALVDLREHDDGFLEARAEAIHDEPGLAPEPGDRTLLERLYHEYQELTDEADPAADQLGSAGVTGVAGGFAGYRQGGEGSEEPEQEEPRPGEPGPGWSAEEEPELSPAGEPEFSFTLAARVALGADDRQALLEMPSERERTTALLAHMARLVPRLRAHEKDRRRVRGNGKPIPPDSQGG